MDTANITTDELEVSSGRPARPRRRDFSNTARKAPIKGRQLLLEDSDGDEAVLLRTGSAPVLATTDASALSFQDIMSSLEQSPAHSRPITPVVTVSSASNDGYPQRRTRHSASARITTTAKELPHLPTRKSETDFRVPRRHSTAPSISSGRSRRQSVDSSLMSSTMQGSFVSLIETEGLDREDLETLKLLKRRQAILRELVVTEASFSEDLAIVVDEYQLRVSSCPNLSKDDARQIFGGVEPVMAFARDFAADLQNAAASVIFSEAVSMESLHYEDAQTAVGIVFCQSLGRLSRVFSRYCSTHESAAKCLHRVSKDATIQRWLADRHPTDKTTAWDLPSLLIKPIQRIMKYPLLLSTLVEATPKTHKDYHAIDLAHKEMLATAESINNIKKRRDLLESVNADRKKNDFTAIAKTFSRRSTKPKQAASIEEDLEKPETAYDRLIMNFRDQETVLETLRLEVQDWLVAMKSALEYHANLASAFEEVRDCRDASPSSMPPAVAWSEYTRAISYLQAGAFIELTHNLEREVFHPLSQISNTFSKPNQMIAQHGQQVEAYHRHQYNMTKGVHSDRDQVKAADGYVKMGSTLTQELPLFLQSTKKLMDIVTSKLARVQSEWYRTWYKQISCLLNQDSDPVHIEDHFHDRYAIMLVQMAEISMLQSSTRVENGSRMRLSEESQASNASTRLSGLPGRPTMRSRALSAANNASLSLKQISSFGRVPSGPPTPTSIPARSSYNSATY